MALPELQRHGAALVIIGSAQPDAIKEFRDATGYDGPLLVDPSLKTFRAARLAHGVIKTFHPRAILPAVRALRRGIGQGRPRGNLIQQGGTFVFGPRNSVWFEWRDRFSGDHPSLKDILATLPSGGESQTSQAARV